MKRFLKFIANWYNGLILWCAFAFLDFCLFFLCEDVFLFIDVMNLVCDAYSLHYVLLHCSVFFLAASFFVFVRWLTT